MHWVVEVSFQANLVTSHKVTSEPKLARGVFSIAPTTLEGAISVMQTANLLGAALNFQQLQSRQLAVLTFGNSCPIRQLFIQLRLPQESGA